jgi:beta-lactam-binding protein with PASTA domain
MTKTYLIALVAVLLAVQTGSAYSGGTGTAANPFQIATKADLLALGATTTDYGKSFIMTKDIDMSAQIFTTAIIAANNQPAFTGTFDGNGHKITGLIIGGGNSSSLGLFGQIDTGSSIKNLGIKNSSISCGTGSTGVGSLVGVNLGSGSINSCFSTGSVNGSTNVGGSTNIGGLVGDNQSIGSISNCFSTCSVSGSTNVGGLAGNNSGNISFCNSTGSVLGSQNVGGLAGSNQNGGHISKCFSTGSASGGLGSSYVGGLVGANSGDISLCSSTGPVSGANNVGGLMGFQNFGTTDNCYSTGQTNGFNNVSGLVGSNSSSNIDKCFSAGAVSGSTNVGGLVGNFIGSGSISNSFWDVQTSGASIGVGSFGTNVDGATGQATADMEKRSTFIAAGWSIADVNDINDANSIWTIIEDVNYPQLAWKSVVTSPLHPVVIAFKVTPLSAAAGNAFTISFTVSDTNTPGLKQVELFRAPDVNGEPNWPTDPNDFINKRNLSGSVYTGSFSDTPSAAGKYWYGIEVFDNNGNTNDEQNSETNNIPGNFGLNGKVTVTPAKVPTPRIIGMTATAANTAITNAGLVVGTVTTAYSNTVAIGNIISQKPAARAAATLGSAVSYVVSLGKPVVPNVVGMTATAANAAILNVHLLVGKVTNVYNDTVPANNVISQSPDAGTSVTVSSRVNYVKSLGQPVVPNIVGKTSPAANTAITKVSLAIGTVTIAYSNTIAAGSVISQNPAAGTTVNIGSAVDYVRSLGKPKVPRVVGMTAADANTAITNVPLVVGTVTAAYSNTVTAGIVIRQSPAANTAVMIGSAVSYVISLGRPVVPDVVGMTAANANIAIKNVSLLVGAVTRQHSGTVAAGNVISQTPDAGTTVAVGSRVKYVISLGP